MTKACVQQLIDPPPGDASQVAGSLRTVRKLHEALQTQLASIQATHAPAADSSAADSLLQRISGLLRCADDPHLQLAIHCELQVRAYVLQPASLPLLRAPLSERHALFPLGTAAVPVPVAPRACGR